MDKNTIIGFVLMAAVFLGFVYYSTPSAEQIQAQHEADSIRQVQLMQQAETEAQAQQQAEAERVLLQQDSTKQLFAARQGEERDVVLENDLVRITFSTRGGAPLDVELKEHLDAEREHNVHLFTRDDASLRLTLDGKQENIVTDELFFTPVVQTEDSLIMRLSLAAGGWLDLAYYLHPDSYMLDFTVTSHGMSDMFPSSMKTMHIEWNQVARSHEKGFNFENRYSSLTYHEKDGGVDNLSEGKDDEEEPDEALDWVAFKTQFFSAVLIAQYDFRHARLQSVMGNKNEGWLKHYSAEMETAFDPSGHEPTRMQMYLGPNDYHCLQDHNDLCLDADQDLELEDIVYLGWPIVRWVNRFFIIYLFDWLTGMGLHMGLVLFLLTLIIKTLVYPTTRKSFLSSARMRVLKPKIDELNAKYPRQEDAMKKQQEMMQIYSQYGVSPMGGCLPMLIQFPIWVALFNFIPNAIEMRGQSFLWAEDLSSYDALIHWDTPIWLIGDHISIFCVLFCAVQIINTWISMKQQAPAMSKEQEQQMKMMKWMMYLMPVMFFFMFNDYSSGLSYYYFISGLMTILTMWYLRATTDYAKLLAKLEAYKAKHAHDPHKVSGMAARLEALQRQAEEMERQRKK